MPGGLLLAATLIGSTGRWVRHLAQPRAERLIDGVPVVLARNGHVYRDVLRREIVSRDDFDEALRESGAATSSDVRLALLETNGHITIMMREGRRRQGRGRATATERS